MDCEDYYVLLHNANRSKNHFLDWFEYLFDIDGRHEDLYDIVIGWSEEKAKSFVNWFDWNLDKIRFRVWKWDRIGDEYIESEEKKEKDLALAGQDLSVGII